VTAPLQSPLPSPLPTSDPFGFDPEFFARVRPLAEFFYRRYWRVKCDGVEHIPAEGPALIVGNHSGGIPFDATMIVTAVDREHPQHRLVRFLYDRFVARMPIIGPYYNRLGAALASFENAERLLEMGDLVGIFPEGVEGVAKSIRQRYHVQPFHSGFVRLSLLHRAPIIPVAVVGAEEIYPVIGKWERLGPLKDLLNVPYVPLTPLFPWFGLLGVVPLPTRWRIRFGAPLRPYEGRPLRNPLSTRSVRSHAEQVRRRIQGMLHALLADRESFF
jgi:1-acyl-sn-glycerol-3-phosphate acyltransferase